MTPPPPLRPPGELGLGKSGWIGLGYWQAMAWRAPDKWLRLVHCALTMRRRPSPAP